ncbi:hypothetical protein BCR36DRAFT_586762 [Piromyces finnis]|uniref:EamA domain-containing protein n=1 Tax=Piromyces finnis TaxID=1754191 RepID=A0A1Y1V0D9_9FUNG|nr:hypothetical protein BCR36DRAFT_586762 [Piromyces finnis]|eukprot:ORX43282.1 hypothetical protein BCR36DRAFT_586762 [Piromyces finnis]
MEETIEKSQVAVELNEVVKDQNNCKIQIQDDKKFDGQQIDSVDKKVFYSVTVGESHVKKIFTKRLNIYIFAIICTFLWASAYPTIRLGYEEFHVDKNNLRACFLFAGFRFTISGALILLGYFVVKKKIVLPKLKMLPDILTLGLITVTLQYMVFYAGVGHTTGVKNSVINSCNTFFSVIMAHFLFKNDRITIRKAIGCLVGFSGVIIINLGFDFFFGNAEKLEFGFTFKGEGFMIMNCLISSIGNVLVKIINTTGSLFKRFKYTKEERERKRIDIILITGWQMFIGAVILDIIALIWIKIDPLEPIEGSNVKPYTSISGLGYLLMFHMGLIAAVAFPIWNTLLKFNNVGMISFFNFLIPVFGTFLSGLLLGENLLKIENFVSLVMVCIGVIIVC